MRNRKRFLGVLALFAILAAGMAAMSETTDLAEKRNRTLDARLQRLLKTPTPELPKLQKSLSLDIPKEGEPTVDILILDSGGADLLDLPGVTLRARIGDVVTATATRSGLQALAEMQGVKYIEPSIRLKRLNDIGTSASSGFSGTLASVGTTDVYPYDAQAGQSLTISMHAAPGSTLDPFLAICQDQNCATILASDDDSGPGTDAELTFTFPSAGTFFISASDAADTETGDYKLVLHNDPSGDFLLGIGAKSLHATGKEGQGVIVGVIDSGIDWCHADFIDDTTGQSRILFLWDQNLTAQAGELAADVGSDGNTANDYGVEYTQSQINTALADCGLVPGSRRVRSADTEGHGTHVAGTAAGDGSATNGSEPAGKYKGAAPKADLVIVKMREDNALFSESASLVDAAVYIFAKAKALNKPAVINMSLGAHDGPVDGTSLLDQAVRNATGPGRIIVAAAGNEGGDGIHAQGTIAANGSDTVTVDLSNCAAPDCTEARINLWYSGGDAYTATLTAPNGQQLSAASGATQSGTLDGVSVEILNATSAPLNGDKNILITIGGQGSARFGWSLTLQRTANGEDGKWDAWVMPDSPSGLASFSSHVPTNPDGSVAGTGGELASSFGAITVGAHSTKFRWDDQAGGMQEKAEAFQDFGSIARFSSRGPTRDGRVKPDVTAPGDKVMSTWSADCPDPECTAVNIALDGRHMIIEGTSMATPMVTGAVALILQADAANFPRPLLKSSAAQDSLTGASLPNSTWGSGKVNLVGAISALQADNPPAVSLSANPASGSATLATTLTATASDPDAGDGIAEYLWDFENDGATDAITTTNTAGKSYTAAGTYTAKVTAVDQRGKTASATTTITVSAPPAGDGGGGGGGGGGCFIATAAYGSYLDPHVQTLRAFRDKVLLQSSWGRAFVGFYYKWSPPAARFIADRPLLKGATRLALTPVVFAVEWPRFSGGILILGVAIIGIALIRFRRNLWRHS